MPEDWNIILCGNVEMIGLSGGNSDAPFVCMLCGNEATA
jgi:hypothetical protein